jgi:endogenous inhibitor of DNA gyrase (YacG/DUF329 family)
VPDLEICPVCWKDELRWPNLENFEYCSKQCREIAKLRERVDRLEEVIAQLTKTEPEKSSQNGE